MTRFLRIYAAFFKQQLKSLMEYKLDFASGMIALFIGQLSGILMIFAVFTSIRTLAGYSFNEILLIYGYSQIVRGIDHIYNDNIWSLGWSKVRDGSFSLYLTRPVSPLLHIVLEKVQFDGIGELVIGLFLFFYAKGRLALHFSTGDIFLFFVFLACGLVIYFCIKLMFASVAFWTVSSGEIMSVVYEVNSFTRYPLDMYQSKVVRFILVYIVPFAVVNFFPMYYFIRSRDPSMLVILGAVTAGMAALSAVVWKLGLRRYEGSGS